MESFGVRFNENFYIRVNIDPESGENDVTAEFIIHGETEIRTITGSIVWDEGA